MLPRLRDSALRFVPHRESQDSVRDWGLHLNAMQGQQRTSGDLFNGLGEAGVGAKSERDDLNECRLVVAS